MGLDTSHNCWHGSYSSFSRWRNELAQAAGYQILPVVYNDGVKRDTIMVDWGHVPDGALMGEWDSTPSDPLMVIIAHSDCEGVIHPAQAEPLASRLEELLDKLPAEKDFGHIGGWRSKTQEFIDGLRLAASMGEDVDFH